MLTVAYSYNLIINACKHNWETIKDIKRTETSTSGSYPYTTHTKTYDQYHLRCTKCGKVIKKDML
jgi:formamidopyrimidine-DNA glycosylase